MERTNMLEEDIVTVTLSRELWPSRASQVEGVIAEVHVSPGDTVGEGDILVEVEVEKAILAIESPVAGIVSRVHVTKGEKVRPGQPLVDIAPVRKLSV